MTILIAVVSVALLVLADQCSKIIATAALADGTTVALLGDFLHITYTRNTGAAWGMFSNLRIFLVLVPLLILLVCLYFLLTRKVRHSTGFFALILVMAGGLGNLIDRIFQPDGAVVDYIYFNFKPLFDFPVFNFADICVTFGGIFLAVYVFFFIEKDFPGFIKKKKETVITSGEDSGTGTSPALEISEPKPDQGGDVIEQAHSSD